MPYVRSMKCTLCTNTLATVKTVVILDLIRVFVALHAVFGNKSFLPDTSHTHTPFSCPCSLLAAINSLTTHPAALLAPEHLVGLHQVCQTRQRMDGRNGGGGGRGLGVRMGGTKGWCRRGTWTAGQKVIWVSELIVGVVFILGGIEFWWFGFQ
jgi:hypothetical protein